MALLVILAILAAIFIGLGFVVKWLFILAAVLVVAAVVSYFMRGGTRSSTRL